MGPTGAGYREHAVRGYGVISRDGAASRAFVPWVGWRRAYRCSGVAIQFSVEIVTALTPNPSP